MQNYINKAMWIFCSILLCMIYIFTDKTDFNQINMQTIDKWEYKISEDNSQNISREITNDIKGKTISFKTKDSFVYVYVNDELLYSFDKTLNIGKSPGSCRHFVQILF